MTGRQRPDYQSLGIDLSTLGSLLGPETGARGRATDSSSGWILFPVLKPEVQHTDNVFRAGNLKRSDTIGLVTPGALLASDWGRHQVTLEADGTFARYARNSGEDYEDYHVVANGRIDATEDLQGFLRVVQIRDHEERGGIDNAGGINSRLSVETTGVALGAIYEVEGIALSPRLQYRDVRYGLTNGGIDTTGAGSQDHVEYIFDGRVSYELTPGTHAFIQPSANRRSYGQAIAPTGLGASSSGYEILAGFVWNVSSVTLIDAGIGYLSQTYDDARVAPVDGPGAAITFVWNPLDAMTVSATVERRVDATNAVDFSSVLLTTGRVSVDVEAADNLIVGAALRAYEADYRGAALGTPSRVDDVRVGLLSARYLLSEHVDFGVQYRYTERTSNQAGLGYVENLFLVQASLRW